MVENPIVGSKFRPYSIHSFTHLLQYFQIISLVESLAFWNEFKVNNIPFIPKKVMNVVFIYNLTRNRLSTIYATQKHLVFS
jgi:hypothetical protein